MNRPSARPAMATDITGSQIEYHHIGTPVPGGLGWDEALLLLDTVVDSGRQVIGFDLVEVSGNAEWDAIVGARLLFRLCLLAAQSHPPP